MSCYTGRRYRSETACHAGVDDGQVKCSSRTTHSCGVPWLHACPADAGQGAEVSMRTLEGERLLRHELVQRGGADGPGRRHLPQQQQLPCEKML